MRLLAAACFILTIKSFGQFPIDDNWKTNPLGFEPLKLHTSRGFVLPAIAVGVSLLLTESNKQKRVSFYDELGISWGYKYPKTTVPQNVVGLSYELRKFLSVGIEGIFFFPFDKYNSTAGYGVRPFARFYTFNKERFKLYFESGGGLVLFLSRFPNPTTLDDRRGTRLNGVTKYGLASEMKISSNLFISLGLKHLHISNGNTKGAARNPSHDSNGIFIGLSIFPDPK